MPVHSKIPICTFIFSHNPLLILQGDSQEQYACLSKIWFELDQHPRNVPSGIRASVDALCRDRAGLISRERVKRGRFTRQGTTS